MGYVEQQLMQGERIVYRAKLTPVLFVLPILAIGSGVVASAALQGSAVGGGLFMIGLVALAATAIRQKTSEFAVTDRRVIIKTGLIGRQTLETQLNKLEGVGVHQSIGGRIFRYGTITVKGTGGTSKPFALISRPMRFRKAVQETASHFTS
ncbi:PH domain-containing protein, partial [bacterium]|nr:PH domain-containing protein [bacterium]